MSCFTCKYWRQKNEVVGHKVVDVGGANPLRHRETREIHNSVCTFNPVWIGANGAHYCGRYKERL